MSLLHIHAQSSGKIFEVLPEEVETTELITENAVSHVLLELFDEPTVDEVTIHFTPASQPGLQICSILIKAECDIQSCTLLPCTKEYMGLAIGKRMAALLKELFGPVTIESVLIQPSVLELR
ncbi:MAG TPA: hypothetical protein VNE38_01065 [Ktedonobacteraceae bacterium]|nr:hypothetical protein [Ktedonobacteraceae bacterium]